MNHPGPGLLNTVSRAALAADLRSLVHDPDASTTITLSTPTATVPDYAAGTSSTTTTDDLVPAHLAPLTLREIGESEGVYQTGDRRALVDASLLTIPPTTATTATIAGRAWKVLQAEVDALGAVWHLILRRST